MQKNILEGVSRGLAAQVSKATDVQKREICLTICKIVIGKTDLKDPLFESALHSLQNEKYKDEDLILALGRYVEAYDDQYFEAQKVYWADETKEDTYRALFRKARVANAILFAFNKDPFVAATHAVYEISAALGTDEAKSIVSSVLNGES